MKTRAHLLPATLLLIGLFGTSASAQDPRVSGRPISTATIVDVEFAGGDLAEFVEAVRGAGRNINVLIPPEATQVSVPAITLREVSVESALRAVAEVTTNNEATVQVSTQRRSGGQPVFTVRVLLTRPAADEPHRASGQRVVLDQLDDSVGDLLWGDQGELVQSLLDSLPILFSGGAQGLS